jgi:hypothetical protein
VTVTNVVSNGTSLTATFQISSSAANGQATVTVTTPGGSTTTPFNITTAMLSKDYIYLGDRVIAVEAP